MTLKIDSVIVRGVAPSGTERYWVQSANPPAPCALNG